MKIDLSLLSSINGLLGSSYGIQSNTQSNANFEDFLMDALAPKKPNDKSSSNALYNLLSNSSNPMLLSGLMSINTTNDTALNAVNGYDVYTTLIGNNNSNTNGFGSAFSSTNVLSDYLSSSLQTSMIKNLNSAKAKLQTSYNDFVANAGDNPSEAASMRMKQMEQNIDTINQYINKNSTTPSLSTLISPEKDFSNFNVADFQNNSSIFDILINSNDRLNNNSVQSLLSQLTQSGAYYQNKLNS